MNKEGWNGFLDLCLSTPDKKDLILLFDLFLTEEEKENLALRYLIIKELILQNKTQREIAKELHVSIAKITRGSNELKRINPKLLHDLLNNLGKKKTNV
jgi:TrpR family trp operon transcriptional repressor